MVIEILICTFNERIKNVSSVLLNPLPFVKYLVSFQYSEDKYLSLIPSVLQERDDVTLVMKEGYGLSKNRNHALMQATGDLLVICDDDVRFEYSFFDNILETFKNDLTLDVAYFIALNMDGKPMRKYPTTTFTYKYRPRGFFFTSCGLVLRNSSKLPMFDARFGLGAEFLGSGEEEVYVHQCYKMGMNVRYIPKPCICTPENTTGDNFYIDERVQRAKGAVLCVMYGPVSAWLRCLKFAFFHPGGKNPFNLFSQMCKGISYITR